MAKTPEKIVDIWQKCVNPLQGLTQRQIEQMLNFARAGNDVILQQCYSLIEQSMPIFGICIDKRQSQIMDLDWKIEGENETAVKRVEEVFKRNQEEEEFDSVEDAIEHLSLYSFRGRSCVKPFFKEGKLTLKKLNNWNILLAPNNRFYFNPSSLPALEFSQLQEVPSSEIAFCTSDRPIDLPGMLIYLRQLVGETKWAQFVERQGIP